MGLYRDEHVTLEKQKEFIKQLLENHIMHEIYSSVVADEKDATLRCILKTLEGLEDGK